MDEAPLPTRTPATSTSQPTSGELVPSSSSGPAPRRPLKRFVSKVKRIPDDILEDPALAQAIAQLPSNYNFEVHKTIWRLREAGATCVALQFPEGLLMYACTLADIMERYVPSVEEVVVMGDVTYGACCIDDLGAKAAGADFLVHYGHSCLVPVTCTALKALYVFVEISVDAAHLIDSLRRNLEAPRRVCLMGTIQFISAVHESAKALSDHFASVSVPQARPLSAGEVLGCTSPTLDAAKFDTLIFVADGRFHLEAAMIANPSLEAYRYDPYDKTLTREIYDTPKMLRLRKQAVAAGKVAKRWGVILGTLGRQGNPALVKHAMDLLERSGREAFILLLSEITPQKLELLHEEVDAWVQVACPRLSIDWGHFFPNPVLTAYELEVALGGQAWSEASYPMDYYAKDGGAWGNFNPANAKRQML
ncbi:diphthamide biosynthesis protein 1 [Nannochloropsis gaditana]|uniref:2-(3-amino-3-carboxypropyl)histidine synthase subunit 1 n=1 Tax=Nannochloropsis gaditana TaxID=72520 RepID=W7U2E3_9STRA|nr:diphthamide biosynthesis protein 1 [Nannochloropsis gaditana]